MIDVFRMKRILFINGHLNAGGVERSLADILRHIDYSKYAVDLLLLEDVGDYLDELPPQLNVIFRDLRNTYGGFLRAVCRCIAARDWICLKMRLLLLLRKWNGNHALKPAANILLGEHYYDCAIGFRRGICSDLVAYSVCAKRKLTWWHHGVFNTDPKVYADMCQNMDAVGAVSSACFKMLYQEVPEIRDKLVYIPNMLDAGAVKEKAQEGIYRGKGKCIVSVGGLVPEKHFENALPTAQAMLDSGIDFTWHIVGDGPERSKLEALITENQMEERIVLEGSKSNPYPYIKNADLFVHPSYVESQGLTVLEAMALGVPCVVTKSLGPCEFIEDGVNGLLTEQSPESLSEKVLEILQDKELYQRIKDNTHCPEQFSPERVMKQIEAFIDG